MYLMLEGQVAALSSGRLLPEEAQTLLDAPKTARWYRNQYSYLLYPQAPTFIHKNTFSGQGHETLLSGCLPTPWYQKKTLQATGIPIKTCQR